MKTNARDSVARVTFDNQIAKSQYAVCWEHRAHLREERLLGALF